MVTLLLFAIVMILLFGAGAVKGWLRGHALHVFGGLLMLLAVVPPAMWLGMMGALGLLLALSLAAAIAKAIWLAEDDPAAKAARKLAADEAWARWEAENQKPGVVFSDYRPSKAEKRKMRDAYRRSLHGSSGPAE